MPQRDSIIWYNIIAVDIYTGESRRMSQKLLQNLIVQLQNFSKICVS